VKNLALLATEWEVALVASLNNLLDAD